VVTVLAQTPAARLAQALGRPPAAARPCSRAASARGATSALTAIATIASVTGILQEQFVHARQPVLIGLLGELSGLVVVAYLGVAAPGRRSSVATLVPLCSSPNHECSQRSCPSRSPRSFVTQAPTACAYAFCTSPITLAPAIRESLAASTCSTMGRSPRRSRVCMRWICSSSTLAAAGTRTPGGSRHTASGRPCARLLSSAQMQALPSQRRRPQSHLNVSDSPVESACRQTRPYCRGSL
jgi:hypothetical protein